MHTRRRKHCKHYVQESARGVRCASRISGALSFFLYIFHEAMIPAMFPVKFPIQFPIAFSPPSSPRLASCCEKKQTSKALAECVLLSKQSGLNLHPSFSSLHSFSQSPIKTFAFLWCNFKVRLYFHQPFCTMLARGLSRRLPTLSRLVQSSHGCSAALLDTKEDRLGDGVVALPLTRSWQFSRGFASDALAGTASVSAAEYGFGFRQLRSRSLTQSPIRGDRGFAKAVALPPQMQKPMKLRVFMGSPGVIGEPWKPLPPPLPFLKRWFTKEGWKIRKQNVQGMLKTGFTLAKIRQKTKGYSQTKFYRDASDLYKEINSALAAGDRSALRQLVTDNVLTLMKKELKHREQGWARVQWELVGPLKSIRTLQGRLIGIDQKNMDTAFAQLTLRIISNQKFAAYDKQGKLVAGDPENELTVEDIWVFERQISHPEVRWKLCGRLSV